MQTHNALLAHLLHDNARALISCHSAIPLESDMAGLVEDAKMAQARGYYTPDEDERLREAYVSYLTVRAAIWETVQSLLPYIELPRKFKKGDWQEHLKAFSIAFCGAAMLLRSGYYLIDMVSKRPVVHAKLDEAEPRYDIARKQFTGIYDSLVSARRMTQFQMALRFYQRHRSEIFIALKDDVFADVADMLRAEEPYFERRIKALIKRKAKFNVFSLRRRRLSAVSKTMFHLFESFGSEIAELKQPLIKAKGAGKRITDEVRTELLELVQPGDVFVTRHDDAMSNLFLPGFWPHAALYIGTDAERAEMGVGASNPEHQSLPGEVRFLESKKDGVLFRPAEDTLQVDACVVLRPKISPGNLTKALNRALSHGGKFYDFAFEFASADKLACTELIYRTYNGFDGVDLLLTTRAGRQCLSAEDLLNQGVSNDWFEVIALFGVGNNLMATGSKAHKRLVESYKSDMGQSVAPHNCAMKSMDDVAWGKYETAYGVATNVPSLLKELASINQDVAMNASHELWCGLCHQHAYISSAALPAFPYILDVMKTANNKLMIEILDIFLGFSICTTPGYGERPYEQWQAGLRDKLTGELPRFIALSSNDDESIAGFSGKIIEYLSKPKM